MNRNQLTLLGCSSLAFMLLAGTPINASEVPSQNLRTIEFKAANAQENPQSASPDLMSDTVGDLAVAKFGCDCIGCRNQVLSMVQSNSLPMSQ